MRNNNNKIKPLAIVFSIIWAMIALQEGWGGDYDAYMDAFAWFRGQSLKDILIDDYHGERGYKILLWLMPNCHTGLILGMAIWCFSMFFFFYHFIPQKWWFFAIVFVFLDKAILMGMIASFFRMAIANTFLIFAMYLVSKEEKWWKSAVLIFAGSFFHRSILFMTPLIFLRPKPNKMSYFSLLGIFVLLTIFMMLFPSSWINFVEYMVASVDAFSGFEYYFENQEATRFKGVSLIILLYWVYLLGRQTNNSEMTGPEYLVMKLALVRIAFDLLPAAGMSTRFFYYIDAYFFAGMMVVFSRLPKNDAHKWALAATLLLMFWYFGFHTYASTDFYKEHWATYNLYF